MKQLTTYQLLKEPIALRNSIEKVDLFFKSANERFLAKRAHLQAIISKIHSR